MNPGLIFALIAAAVFTLIVGLGAVIAFALYTLDRAVFRARFPNAAQVSTAVQNVATYAEFPAALAGQLVTAEGYLEVAPTLGVDNRKLGVWVFLASEVIFFSALIATFLAFQVRSNIDASNVLNLPLTSVNTFILIVSSFTVVNALDAVQQGKHGLFRLMLLFTLVLGALFVGIQGREWAELIHKGVTPSNDIFGTAFFVLTGFHGLHVIVGLIWLLFVIARALRGDFSAGNNLGVETFGLYWHFVDIVWIVLFAIIYLI